MLATSNRIGVGLERDPLTGGTLLHGDKKVSEAVVQQLSKRLNEIKYNADVANLQQLPLTVEKCVLALRLIKDLPNIAIVPNKMNTDDDANDGSYYVVRSWNLSIDNLRKMAIVTEDATGSARRADLWSMS